MGILCLEFMFASNCAVASALKRSLIQSSPCDVAFNVTTTFTFKLIFYAQIEIFEEMYLFLHTYSKCHFVEWSQYGFLPLEFPVLRVLSTLFLNHP